MDNAFFFQTQQIPDSSSIFNQLKEQNIFFSYFLVDQNYYLFVYAQQSIDINLLYQSVEIIQELDSKQRKIRSLRGFFLYALEIMGKAEDYEILDTNLQPFFWRKVKNIIRQNKKGALLEFLFGKGESNKSVNQVSSLAQQVERLQHKVLDLEAKLMRVEQNSKYPLIGTLDAPDDTKLIQQGDSSLKPNIGSYLQENDTKINPNLQQVEEFRNEISESVSEASKTPKIASLNIEDSNLKQNKAENESNFVTLSQISEQEKIEVIQRGFQLQAEGKISLKKYYENTDPNSLFQLKGYSIKYESIRRTSLYKSLKE